MKYLKFPVVAIVFTLAIFLGCKRDTISKQETTANEAAVAQSTTAKKIALDALLISCAVSTDASITIQVCAGASGAPAGFSVQWMLKSDYDTYGWSDDPANSASFCKASFSGVPGCSSYKLAAKACMSVKLGENLFGNCGESGTCTGKLDCGKNYVFRAFAHNDPVSGAGKSDFSSTLTCNTLPCSCTYSQGYWKTHGPVGCSPGSSTNVWPVNSLKLGTVTYTDLQLCSILNTPPGGNGLIILAHQLIAAKLNIAKGANGSSIASSIASADALIGSLVIPPVGSGHLSASATGALVTALTNYNEGVTGPGHCQ